MHIIYKAHIHTHTNNNNVAGPAPDSAADGNSLVPENLKFSVEHTARLEETVVELGNKVQSLSQELEQKSFVSVDADQEKAV